MPAQRSTSPSLRLSSPSIQRLLNATERALAADASASAVKALTAPKLRSKITRARRLQEKYEGQSRSRSRAARGARGGRTPDVATPTRKADVFREVVRRFVQQLERVEAKATAREEPAARKARVRKAVARVKQRVARMEGAPAPDAVVDAETPVVEEVAAENTARRAVSRASKADRVAQTLDASHVTRAHGHIGSRTQRRQARRDSKS